MKKPLALVLHAAGTNRDNDAATALLLAGAEADIVHINQLKTKQKKWSNYTMLVIPGGFSYADALGAGKIFALDLLNYFYDEISLFIESKKPVIGICNGFQVLVKTGLLPSGKFTKTGFKDRTTSLVYNSHGSFECRYTKMQPVKSACIWTKNLQGNLICPIAHGEGRFIVNSDDTLKSLYNNNQVALVYSQNNYPHNPNGSVDNIAGICNSTGTVLGLMPHPENNVVIRARDSEAKKAQTKLCLDLWKAGVNYAASI